MMKTMARYGKATFSNWWMKLCPMNATKTCSSTINTSATWNGKCVSVLKANVPLIVLTANQPMPAVSAFKPAGRKLPR